MFSRCAVLVQPQCTTKVSNKTCWRCRLGYTPYLRSSIRAHEVYNLQTKAMKAHPSKTDSPRLVSNATLRSLSKPTPADTKACYRQSERQDDVSRNSRQGYQPRWSCRSQKLAPMSFKRAGTAEISVAWCLPAPQRQSGIFLSEYNQKGKCPRITNNRALKSITTALKRMRNVEQRLKTSKTSIHCTRLEVSPVALQPFFTNTRQFSTSRHLAHAQSYEQSIKTPTGGRENPLPARERLQQWETKLIDGLKRSNQESYSALAQGVLNAQSRGLPPAYSIHRQGDKLILSSPFEDANGGNESIDIFDYANEELGPTDSVSSGYFHSPGDVVEIIHGGESLLAVIVRRMEQRTQVYTMDGQWAHIQSEIMCRFLLPNFFKQSEVDKIKQYLPEMDVPDMLADVVHAMAAEVPRRISQPILERMQLFFRDSQASYRTYAREIDDAHAKVADCKRVSYQSLREISCKILNVPNGEDIPKPALFAVHRHLSQMDGFMPRSVAHWDNDDWEVISIEELDNAKQVSLWAREHQEAAILLQRKFPASLDHETPHSNYKALKNTILSKFVRQVRSVIQQSRRHRSFSDLGLVGPDSHGSPKTRCYGENDRECVMIIRFMELWALRLRIWPRSPLYTVGSAILRATGLYQGQALKPELGFAFLIELGVLNPWENGPRFTTRLNYPGATQVTEQAELKYSEAQKSALEPHIVDSMAELRKDWENLQVFCVDDAAAKEIDDGFSLEEISGEPNMYWLHVHVANPTAFISPDDPISQYAATLHETIYFPDHTYNMLPSELVQKQFSLDVDRPVITFSAKISKNGEIFEHKITPGLIRKVAFMTPETLGGILFPNSRTASSSATYQVGPTIRKKSIKNRKNLTTSIPAEQTRILLKIRDLVKAIRGKADAKGFFLNRTGRPNVIVSGDTLSANVAPERFRRIKGDPTITVQANFFESEQDLATQELDGASLVQTVMMIACEVAGLWSKARGIPNVYRCSIERPGQAKAMREMRGTIISKLLAQQGVVSWLMVYEWLRTRPKSTVAASPQPHAVLGVQAYVKATSPLRRYADMVAHWQIESALRLEAELGRQTTAEDTTHLPFSQTHMEGTIQRFLVEEPQIRQTTRKLERSWYCQLLARAHHFGESSNLPRIFNMYIENSVDGWSIVKGPVRELGISCKMKANEVVQTEGGFHPGDWWEVKLDSVRVFNGEVVMEPLRLTSRRETSSSLPEPFCENNVLNNER